MWSTYEEVEQAITTIKKWIDETGVIPDNMVMEYRKEITESSYNIINYFYERLEHEAPDALLLFLNGYMHKPK